MCVRLPAYKIIPFDQKLLDIRYEDDDIIAVWKPHNINTCPSIFSDIDCLSHGIDRYLARRDGYIPNTIHRLDRATSGLVLFAKHKVAEKALFLLFYERRIHKYYQLVCPDFKGAQAHYAIHDYLDKGGKLQTASTLFFLMRKEASFLHYLAKPLTGRTHQIRKHCKNYLQAIIGDQTYGNYATDTGTDTGADTILLLSCVAYRFVHPFSGKTLRLRAEAGF